VIHLITALSKLYIYIYVYIYIFKKNVHFKTTKPKKHLSKELVVFISYIFKIRIRASYIHKSCDYNTQKRRRRRKTLNRKIQTVLRVPVQKSSLRPKQSNNRASLFVVHIPTSKPSTPSEPISIKDRGRAG
jgi:hypothetical protein